MSRVLAVETDDFRIIIEDNGVAELVFGHVGEMPTLGARGHAELALLWRRIALEPGVRVVLVRSDGKGFCAGGHTELVDEMMHAEVSRARVMREARDIVQGIIDCDIPIVSAINGAAVGAGAAVALLADVSIAAKSAKIIDGHTKIGVAAGDHAVLVWPLLCGMAKAKYHLLTCEALTGEQAERIGLVSLAVDDDRLVDEARRISSRLAAGSVAANAYTKRSLNHWLRAAWPAFEHSLALEMIGFGTEDARAGFRRLKDRRAAG